MSAVSDASNGQPATPPGLPHEAPAGLPHEAPPGPWIDNHCHITPAHLQPADDGSQAVVDAAVDAGVIAMITVGTDAASSAACLEVAASDDRVFATAGVHPHDAVEGTAALRDVVDAARGGRDLVAIGECGLDYHYDHSPRETQRAVFAEQIAMAHELDLPLVIHTRSAWDDTFAILASEGTPRRTVFHCFTGGPDEGERAVELGALMSISGIVTFPSATELREAVTLAPLESLMVETDSPYLTPVPYRGRRNRPALVGFVGAEVAALQGRAVDEVARATTRRADAFYSLGVA